MHIRITFPPLLYAAAVANFAPDDMAVVVATGVMSMEIQKLQTKVIVLTYCSGPGPMSARAADVAYHLHRQLRIPHWCIVVSLQKSKHFLVRFDYPNQRGTALHIGSVFVSGAMFLVEPWRMESCT
jgi:hypothetical protein